MRRSETTTEEKRERGKKEIHWPKEQGNNYVLWVSFHARSHFPTFAHAENIQCCTMLHILQSVNLLRFYSIWVFCSLWPCVLIRGVISFSTLLKFLVQYSWSDAARNRYIPLDVHQLVNACFFELHLLQNVETICG